MSGTVVDEEDEPPARNLDIVAMTRATNLAADHVERTIARADAMLEDLDKPARIAKALCISCHSSPSPRNPPMSDLKPGDRLMTLPPHLTLPVGIKRGDKGPTVKLLQEWLDLNGHPVAIDSDFGPATEAALNAWRGSTGPLTARDCDRLTELMSSALETTGSIVEVARSYLDNQAREIGGNNRGPWVRLFTGGHDGPGYLWCGYFMRHVARQAGHPWAERISPSCDETAEHAIKDGRMRLDGERPRVGDLFLLHRRDTTKPSGRDYYHIGVVATVKLNSFGTIEGNSNDDGSANGHEVAVNWRPIHRGGVAFVRSGDQ